MLKGTCRFPTDTSGAMSQEEGQGIAPAPTGRSLFFFTVKSKHLGEGGVLNYVSWDLCELLEPGEAHHFCISWTVFCSWKQCENPFVLALGNTASCGVF